MLGKKTNRSLKDVGALSLVSLALLCLVAGPQSASASPSTSTSTPNYTLPSDHKKPVNPYAVTSAERFPSLERKLRGTSGFVGGDSAYSIVLSPNKSLWLFGDSFIGKIAADGKRKDCKMVRNTVALDDPTKPAARPTFYVQEPAFFKCGKNFYWPGDGLMYKGKLYVFMHETESAPKQRPPFQFNPLHDHLMIVQNPMDSPPTWKIKEYNFLNPSSNRQLGIATVLDGDYIYIYLSNTAIRVGLWKNPTGVARLKKSDLEAGKIENLEWLADGGWQPKPAFLDTMWEDGTSEMTVTKVSGLPGFFAFYLPFGNNAIMMRHADRPDGPWSKPVVAYTLPKASKDIFFYSAKAHPQYSKGKGEVALTYCDNSSVFSRVLNDAKLYFPTALKVKITAVQ